MGIFRINFRPHPDRWTRQAQRATDRLMRRLPQVMDRLGESGAGIARDEAPKDTGRYAASHGHEVQRIPGGARVVVGPGVGSGNSFGAMFGGRDVQSLALWITSGTRPHTITGNPYLAFFWEKVGRFVIVHSVNHPGTKPNDYMGRMFRRWRPHAERNIRRLGEDWIKDIEG